MIPRCPVLETVQTFLALTSPPGTYLSPCLIDLNDVLCSNCDVTIRTCSCFGRLTLELASFSLFCFSCLFYLFPACLSCLVESVDLETGWYETTSTLLVVVTARVVTARTGPTFFLLNLTFSSLSAHYRLFFFWSCIIYIFIAVASFLGDWLSHVLSLSTVFSRIDGEDMSVLRYCYGFAAGVLGAHFPWHYFGGWFYLIHFPLCLKSISLCEKFSLAPLILQHFSLLAYPLCLCL